MSGYVYLHGPCFVCKRVFSYNPNHVPSIYIDPQTGLPPDVEPQPGGYERARREPLCLACVTVGNRDRVAQGKEPFPVHPEAYEPEPEAKVLW
jgi:hypothetical protein